MLNGCPLFAGKDVQDQLDHIFRAMGTPTDDIYPGFSKLPLHASTPFAKYPAPASLASLIPSSGPDAVDLLEVRVSAKRC